MHLDLAAAPTADHDPPGHVDGRDAASIIRAVELREVLAFDGPRMRFDDVRSRRSLSDPAAPHTSRSRPKGHGASIKGHPSNPIRSSDGHGRAAAARAPPL